MHVVLPSRVSISPSSFNLSKIPFFWLGLKLTLPLFVAGGPSEGVAGFSQENWSLDRVASVIDSSSQDDPLSSSSSGERVSSFYTQGSSLLGTAKKLVQPSPWSVVVRSYWPNESVNGKPSPNEAPFFFFYEPVFSKFNIKLPFTAFERSKVSKVGWMSLSGRPRRKLLKPFLESFKTFKDKFFKVNQGKSGPNILVDQSGTPYFPLYWTSQPAVSVTIVRKDLEKWEDEFIVELETLPYLSCSELICGIGFFVKYLKDMKKKLLQGAEEGTSAPVAAVPKVVPLSHLEKNTAADPLIISEGS
ncbi:hypothetical protein CR513_17566, partial [Mucuna pruriens]